MQSPEASPALDRALDLLRDGKFAEATTVVEDAVKAAAARYGATSHLYAAALNDLGTVLSSLGEADRATEAFRVASEGQPALDPEVRRAQLTYLLNYGQALADAGRHKEAEAVLRRDVAEREAFYGRTHPNYASGLEALGAVLLETGQVAEAVPLFNEAARLYWPEQDPRLAGATAYRALAMRAAGSPDPPYAGLDSLPADIVEEMAATLLDILPDVPLPVQRAALADLFPFLSARLPEDDAAMINTLSAIANVEQALGAEGRAKVRQESIRRVGAIYERQGRPHEAVETLLGLALAHDDANEYEEADRIYREAEGRARAMGDPELHSQVLRNFGLHLMERGAQNTLADTALAQAVEAGRASGDAETLGRALVALAALQRQTDRPAEAAALLDEAIALLGPAHPDAKAAHILRTAIESSKRAGRKPTA